MTSEWDFLVCAGVCAERKLTAPTLNKLGHEVRPIPVFPNIAVYVLPYAFLNWYTTICNVWDPAFKILKKLTHSKIN